MADEVNHALVTPLVMLLQFGGTSFVHGLIIIGVLYCVLPFYLWAVGLIFYFADIIFSGAERTGKREWKAFISSCIPRAAIEYFGMKLLIDDNVELKEELQYLFVIHPHGIFPYGGLALYCPKSPLLLRFPWLKIHPCGATICFKTPFIREYLLWTGHYDASRRVMSKKLAEGKTLAIIPGGEAEAIRTENGREQVILKGRKGFVSLALQYGVPLVPTYTFGLSEVFITSKTALFTIRDVLQKKLKVAIPVFWGIGGTPMPRRVPLSFAVGKPIAVPPNPSQEKPSDDLVDEYHAKYVEALEALFKQHRAAAGYGDRELEVMSVNGEKPKGK